MSTPSQIYTHVHSNSVTSARCRNAGGDFCVSLSADIRWCSEEAMGSCLSCPEKESIPDNHQSKFKVSSCLSVPRRRPRHVSAHTLDYSLMTVSVCVALRKRERERFGVAFSQSFSRLLSQM